MKIKVPHKNYSIIELYETAATQMGHLNTSELEFDCRKINIAKNIQDGFYKYYTELVKETDPNMSETSIQTEITMLLAIGGPKVDAELADYEVEIFDGFVC